VSKMKETDPKGKKEVNGQGVDFSSSNKQLWVAFWFMQPVTSEIPCCQDWEHAC
jgi:hypothetical protein